jgi:CxxC-x17-CxxC domain-containing protein
MADANQSEDWRIQVTAMTDQTNLGDIQNLTDKTLVCRDCGITFVFTAGEQAFYREKGLVHDPQRCSACRANRRRERTGQPPREMHQVVCAECGAQTMVPFLPRQDRPVYCSTCYDRVRLTT